MNTRDLCPNPEGLGLRGTDGAPRLRTHPKVKARPAMSGSDKASRSLGSPQMTPRK